MKGLTLHQPWATLVMIGAKRIETRSWTTRYRGWLAIHSAQQFPREARMFAYRDPAGAVLNAAGFRLGGDCAELPLGRILGVAHLVDIVPTGALSTDGLLHNHRALHERAFGNYAPGRFAWKLADVRPLVLPIPCRGSRRLWPVPSRYLGILDVLIHAEARP